MKPRRSFWLTEIAFVSLISSSLMTGSIVLIKRLNESRLEDLKALQMRHVASLIWHQEMQGKAFEKRGIFFESFDAVQKIQVPPFEFVLREENETECFDASLVFVKRSDRVQKPWKRQICAILTLSKKRSSQLRNVSERHLTLIRK